MQTSPSEAPAIYFVDDINCTAPLISSWSFAVELIDRRKTFWTSQMGLLTLPLLDMGYRVFIRDLTGAYEIHLGPHNERTEREIKTAHNLFRMWLHGEFDP